MKYTVVMFLLSAPLLAMEPAQPVVRESRRNSRQLWRLSTTESAKHLIDVGGWITHPMHPADINKINRKRAKEAYHATVTDDALMLDRINQGDSLVFIDHHDLERLIQYSTGNEIVQAIIETNEHFKDPLFLWKQLYYLTQSDDQHYQTQRACIIKSFLEHLKTQYNSFNIKDFVNWGMPLDSTKFGCVHLLEGCVEHDNVPAAELFLACGADPNQKYKKGNALGIAASKFRALEDRHHYAMIELLMRSGAKHPRIFENYFDEINKPHWYHEHKARLKMVRKALRSIKSAKKEESSEKPPQNTDVQLEPTVPDKAE